MRNLLKVAMNRKLAMVSLRPLMKKLHRKKKPQTEEKVPRLRSLLRSLLRRKKWIKVMVEKEEKRQRIRIKKRLQRMVMARKVKELKKKTEKEKMRKMSKIKMKSWQKKLKKI